MPPPFHCPDCGAALPEGQPQSLCPRCVLSGLVNADGAPESPRGEAAATPSEAGRRFGDYELLQEIARGGMGIVYKARQKSLDRIVAVKLLPSGTRADADFIKRFRVEASAAAALQHPNIVAIHEVGVHEGEHFIAMEFVDGPNLARLVREQPLPPRRAAAYLRAVADAIHYAHEHGILHRDLKPSNVLLDPHDQPRVTDFGLAKRVGTESQPETDVSQLTLSGQVMGSPSYMPPEQAAGRRGAMGRRSDVYSLGAMLYHLLTGRPPFGGGSPAETLRQVETQEPISLRLLNSSVPLDLETICLKCLEKSPARRYATAQELAEELTRFLNNESISARPVGRPERVWRWCRRKPALAALAGAGLIIAGLTAAVAVISTVSATRLRESAEQQSRLRAAAEAQSRRARTEARKSERVARFLKEMLAAVNPSVAMGRDTALLRDILDHTARRVGSDLADQPEVEGELRMVLAKTYHALDLYEQAADNSREALRIARMLHGPTNHNAVHAMTELGDALRHLHRFEEAEPLLREGLRLQKEIVGVDAETYGWINDLASLCEAQGRFDEAEQLFREALAGQERLGSGPGAVTAMGNLGSLLAGQGRHAEAENLLSNVVRKATVLVGPRHPGTLSAMTALGELYRQMRRYQEAESLFRQALAISLNIRGPEHPRTITLMNNHALALIGMGRLDEAETNLARIVEFRRQRLGPDHTDTLLALQNLAHAYSKQGRLSLAESVFTNLAATLPRVRDGSRTLPVLIRLNLGALYRNQGRYADAEPLLTNVLTAALQVLPPGDSAATAAVGHLIDIYRSQGRTNDIERVFQQVLATLRDRHARHPSVLADVLLRMADLLGDNGYPGTADRCWNEILRLEGPGTEKTAIQALNRLITSRRQRNRAAEAVPLAQQRLALAIRFHGPDNGHVGDALYDLSAALSDAGFLPEAETNARAALEMFLKTTPDDGRMILSARGNLAHILWNRGDRDGAEKILRDALAAARKTPADDPALLENHLVKLAELLQERLQFAETVAVHREVVQSRRARRPADDDELIDSTADLAMWLTEWAWKDRTTSGVFAGSNPAAAAPDAPPPAERAREAERLLQDCLGIREKRLRKDSTRLGETRGRLGSALVARAAADPALSREARLALLAKAEPLLVEAHAAQQKNEFAVRRYALNAFIRLGRLHETWDALAPATGHAALANAWRQRRDEFHKSSASAPLPPAAATNAP